MSDSEEDDVIDTDLIFLTPIQVDLDIDSDNTGTIEHSEHEDGIEDDARLPGKIIPPDRFTDSDGDSIPDFVDGYNFNLGTSEDDVAENLVFTQIVLELSNAIELSDAKISFNYDHSNPYDVNIIDEGDYVPLYGSLRIWKKNGNEPRNGEAANATTNAGDYVPSGTYTADQLGFTSSRTVTLYVEGIEAAYDRIVVEVDPDGDGPRDYEIEDAVRVTVADARDDVFYFNSEDAIFPENETTKTYDVRLNDHLPQSEPNHNITVKLKDAGEVWKSEVELVHGRARVTSNQELEYQQTGAWTETEKVTYGVFDNGTKLFEATAFITSGFKYKINSFGKMGDKSVTAERGLALLGGGGTPDGMYPWMFERAAGGDFVFLAADNVSGGGGDVTHFWEVGNQIDSSLDHFARQGAIDSVEEVIFVYDTELTSGAAEVRAAAARFALSVGKWPTTGLFKSES